MDVDVRSSWCGLIDAEGELHPLDCAGLGILAGFAVPPLLCSMLADELGRSIAFEVGGFKFLDASLTHYVYKLLTRSNLLTATFICPSVAAAHTFGTRALMLKVYEIANT
jgi:hypothetical protein